MKKTVLLASISLLFLGALFATGGRRRQLSAPPPAARRQPLWAEPAPATAESLEPSSGPASLPPVAIRKATIDPAGKRAAASRPASRRIALRPAAAGLSPKARDNDTRTLLATRPSGGRREAEKKTAPSAEALAAWTHVPGSAVRPVLSPRLGDVMPIRSRKDRTGEVDNRLLPYRGDRGNRPALRDGALQSLFGESAPTPTGVNFAGTGADGVAPSDANGRVGPNHYVQWVNARFAIFSKTGTPLYGPADGNTLFTALGGPCATQNNGDPIVQYDILADRWILSQFAVDAPPTGLASYQCMAVSVTGNPLGAYYLYSFPLSPTLFYDYPHIATWPDAYYGTFHVFDELQDPASQFQNQGLVIFERAAMIAGLPARVQVKSIGTAGAQEYYGGLAADLDSLTPPPPGSPEYVIVPGSPEFDGSAAPVLHFFKVATTWGATPSATITGPTNILTAPFNANLCDFSRNCIPQPPPAGADDKLDPLPGQLMWRLAYRNFGTAESLVVKHTVNALTPPANQAAVRWYEIRSPGTTPTIFQQGTFAPDSENRWAGSAAQDNGGNIAIGYSKSSAATRPQIDVTGRLAGDPLGTMGAEIVMQSGPGVQLGTFNRWGDYSGMSVDPRDGCTFWYTTQYLPATGEFAWGTRIASFRFPPANCSPPPQGTLTGVVRDGSGSPIAGALVQLDNGFSGATDAAGLYTIVLPPGDVNATASAPQRPGCVTSASFTATIAAGATTTRDFTLAGSPALSLGPVVLDDSGGNGNGHVNRNECFLLDLPLDNIGCATADNVSAVLTSSTPGVTITRASASYGGIPTGARRVNTPRFGVATSGSLVCGNPIDFTLTVTSSTSTTVLPFVLPTCDTPVTVAGAITAADPNQTQRLARDSNPSACGPAKTCPGPFSSGTRHFESYSFTNTAATSRCITVEVAPSCAEGASQLFSATYLGAYNPASLCANYLADMGSSPSNGGTGSYSFDVPAGASFLVVVNEIDQNTFCSAYALKVSGLDDLSDGGRPAAPSAGSNGPVCAGGTLNLTASTIPGATYAWTGPNGFTSTQQNPTIPNASLAAAGTYSVVAAVGACPSPAGTTTVAISAPPSAAITAPATACAGSTGNVASVPDAGPGATYVWTISGGTLTGGAGTRSVTFTAGASGSVSLGVTVSDSDGCSAAAGATVAISTSCVGSFFTVTPCRVLDTRHPAGPYGAPSMGADTARTVSLAGQCGVPATATAVSINLTVTNPTANGFLTLFPAGGVIPITSTINFRAGQTRANNAIPVLNGTGDLGLYCGMPGTMGTVDVIIDVNGYFQ